jgi:predicted ATPase
MIESDYVAGNPDIARSHRMVVISGCSGSGKSSLLSELASRGYDVVPEAGRQIVKEQLYIGGDALPWANSRKFVELLLSRAMYQYNSVRPQSAAVFFDRSIVEPVSGSRGPDGSLSEHAQRAVQQHRYWKEVFLTPPWKEIFVNDPERPYKFADVAADYTRLMVAFQRYGYTCVELPKVSIAQRADFIETQLNLGKA